ncbi:MAG: fluoride efflux transporter CrcB [Haloechinothrix sp.]
MTLLLVAIGGALGASLRYLIDRRVQRLSNADFPWGTLTVNIIGSAVLGALTGLALRGDDTESLRAFLGIGLCGSLTTFSSFGYETIRLLIERARPHAIANVVVTVCAGFAAASAGILFSQAL